ncbi:putative catalytic subunit of the poly(A)-nuclease (PAN) deadenylation complex, one of two cytoplasmic mRNA deadenylases involved in mRNA turnover [Lyophyllum shimeji]|uniref:PAN2-PAN3 deadenylation complex catalytic subunit PAN2 n=1 Tax=Lyophyllum shimeji TaxID=47721 RepID=A0A9P3UL00_LYOSH|nr:putative catalytic subunit of the poly(A)-nuclease (PAN) deadenylation complex, one of two cytoplasmic mRNA deadenylases involved in mRNA turnover [Lyophyllum shimeji]
MATSYRQIAPITLSEFSQPVTALSFDPVSDILWAGSNSGVVAGYYGTRGTRGVSFPVGGSLAVKKIVAGENHVRALGVSGEGLGTWAKGGMNKWFFRHPSNIATFSNTPNSNVVAASTADMELLYINSMTGTAIRQTTMPSVITHLQSSHSFLLSGASDGYLRTHDMRASSNRPGGGESSVKAHSIGIQGLETTGNFVFTIGLGERQGRPYPDPLVKVYDLRTMGVLSTIPFSSGPAFVHVLPKRPSTIAVISNQGLINIVDVLNPAAAGEFYQLDLTSYITSCSVSATAAYMAFGDADGIIHLMSQAEDVVGVPFNGFDGQPAEWADTPAPLPEIDWTDATPLNTVGLPFYDTPLLSAWTPQFVPTPVVYLPPPKIPPQLLNTMKMKDNVAYAALPRELKGRRNTVAVDSQKYVGRFRSGKFRKADLDAVAPTFDSSDSEIPAMYRRVEIEYSKFGVEDFDFGFYNKTEYSGLETHILNSYTNPVLQVMHYSLPIRTLAKSHITTNCPREHCLLCELGFVVLGVLAQASNAIELIDYGREGAEVDYAHKIQIFHRFLIDHLSSEGNSFPNNPSLLGKPPAQFDPHTLSAAPVTQLLGIDGKNFITCSSCGAVREKDNMTHIVDLTYPRKGPSNEQAPAMDFAGILRHSLLRQLTHKATCQNCKHFTNFTSRRSISSRDLPPILAINACVSNNDNLALWLDVRGQTFLKPQIELRGQVEGVDDQLCTAYAIRSLIVQVTSKEKPSHLVAIVKVPEAGERTDLKSPWFLFNDFVVQNISEQEALSFPGKWKVPAIIYYERVDLREIVDYSGLPNKIDESILSYDTSISLNRDPRLMKHEFLKPEELPRPGTLVAIDAEFVLMQQEETEFRSDGTNRVLRPARLSLARVSVLRGDGPKQGVPFIDDHIHTSEAIVDYLTEFSGIKFGDLDPHISRYTLTPLKLVYKKLRLLVDRGCIFIGHGLSKDFRIINIYVPPEQVIDTVDLYFLKSRQRRLSLRFLSWFVLGQHIQTDMHDSIEDARSALKLYKAYHQFEEEGTFDQKLEELYKEGRLYNFKPPPLDSSGALALDRTASPAYPIPQTTVVSFPRNLHAYTSNWPP